MIISLIHLFKIKIIQKRLFEEIIRFYSASLISCIVNLGSRYLLNFIFSFVQSVFISSILGGIANFILVKKYVFRSNNKIQKELILYAIISIFGICFITTLSAGFEKISSTYHIIIISQNITYFFIQLFSLGINSLIGFFLCRYIVFTGSSCIHKID